MTAKSVLMRSQDLPFWARAPLATPLPIFAPATPLWKHILKLLQSVLVSPKSIGRKISLGGGKQ